MIVILTPRIDSHPALYYHPLTMTQDALHPENIDLHGVSATGLQGLAAKANTLTSRAPEVIPPGPTEVTAIISDVHANLEALTVVLGEIDRRGIKKIVCLGDVVGYGPNPLECMDLVAQRAEWSLLGNHDFAIFFEPYNFNTAAENAAFWSREQFENDKDLERRNRRFRYLGSMPTKMHNSRFIAYHGSPRKPINEYIFPDDVYSAPQKMNAIFDRINKLCFVGHTHVPGVFVPDPDFYSPDELGGKFQIPEERVLINVGSVGQPRDRNPKASFAILYPPEASSPQGWVEFIRLDYDIEKTVAKVKAIDELDNFLGARLLDGR